MGRLTEHLEFLEEGDVASLLNFAKGYAGKVALVYPGFFPLELLEAAGFWPITTWYNFQTAPADAHLAPFACTFSRTFLSFALENRTLFDALALSNICDTSQNLFAISKKLFPDKKILWLHLPQNPTSLAAKDYISAQIKKIWEQIANERELGKIEEAITARNTAKALINMLNGYRAKGTLKFSAWRKALFLYFFLPASYSTPFIYEILEEAKMYPLSKNRVRLFVLGKLIAPSDVPEFLESLGATIVGDSMLFGERSQLVEIPQSGDSIETLVNHLSAIPASPYHHVEPYDYAESVKKRASELGANGAIIFRLKYCDPEAFDYPALKDALEEAKIPTLLLEVEMTKKLSGHEKTRIEAFVESLKGK